MNEATKSFIEVQFPVSKISKESYKERKGAQSQTLTGLGKWWGRKPLILIRATVLGLLMPASDNPNMDRDIFIKILSMDNDGLLHRKKKSMEKALIYELSDLLERDDFFDVQANSIEWLEDIPDEIKEEIENQAFLRLSYDDKLKYCARPEQIGDISEESWNIINEHLGTNSHSLVELIQELGHGQFGHDPKIGDSFCGGGSIPFEAARIGCEVFASDLNPVAGLLTWASLNILNKEGLERIKEFQHKVYDEVVEQLDIWGIEKNESGWRARYYLYCNETVCPECGYRVPMAPSWVTSERQQKTAVELIPNHQKKAFDFQIKLNLTHTEHKEYASRGTVRNSRLNCPNPNCGKQTPISALRDINNGNGSLREWTLNDYIHHEDDVFQERLYCICYEETYMEDERIKKRWHFVCPDEKDMIREKEVLSLLSDKFDDWQEKGYIPSRRIEPGEKTNEPIRTRGWTYWHHLFNPRQLLLLGMLLEVSHKLAKHQEEIVASLIGLNRAVNHLSKLCRWNAARDECEEVFYNQALNTLFNYGSRTSLTLQTYWMFNIKPQALHDQLMVKVGDARSITEFCDVWITDPPYADAVNYHELTEFFLAWDDILLKDAFSDWYSDSKRALAISGRDEDFRKNMVVSYHNLVEHMPDNGLQVVMFTHQDAGVWADLALILWAAGLQVTAAWCIGTETDSALKKGNYVQGTVILVLRKQRSELIAFLDEIYPEVEAEVKSQMDIMRCLDDEGDPNFGDTDYQLAAYAAALRVLTKYCHIEEIDVEKELSRVRQAGEVSPVEQVIAQAVEIACNYLIPGGIEKSTWKAINPEERFYIKGLEMESHGEYRAGAYQELARGFGLREYTYLMESSRANENRLKTATEFASRNLSDGGFGISILRHTLFAVREVVRTEETEAGRNWLNNELKSRYWDQRQLIIALLDYLGRFELNQNMKQWHKDAHAAHLLMGAIRNEDHI